MESLRVQASFWCKSQVRLFVAAVERKFGSASLVVPDFAQAFEDHRTPTNGAIADTDEIDLLSSEVGPSIHLFFDVDSGAADLIEQAVKESAMQMILIPVSSSLSDHQPRILKPFVDIS